MAQRDIICLYCVLVLGVNICVLVLVPGGLLNICVDCLRTSVMAAWFAGRRWVLFAYESNGTVFCFAFVGVFLCVQV